MSIKQYRNLIVKVLQQSSGKKLSAEQVADILLARIQAAEEVLADLGPDALIAPLAQQDLTGRDLIMAGAQTPSMNIETDISRKITAEPSADLVEKFTVEQLVDFAKNEMPSIVTVQPAGFEAPFAIRKFVEAAPGNIGFVRIVYQQEQGQMVTDAGQRIGPTLQISTTDQSLDADALTENIRVQANAMYSAVKSVLVPKRAPVLGSPGDLTRALGAEAGGGVVDIRGMSDAQIMSEAQRSQPAEWADRISSPTASQAWQGQRRRDG